MVPMAVWVLVSIAMIISAYGISLDTYKLIKTHLAYRRVARAIEEWYHWKHLGYMVKTPSCYYYEKEWLSRLLEEIQ